MFKANCEQFQNLNLSAYKVKQIIIILRKLRQLEQTHSFFSESVLFYPFISNRFFDSVLGSS